VRNRVDDFAGILRSRARFDASHVPGESAITEDAVDPIGEVVTSQMSDQTVAWQ